MSNDKKHMADAATCVLLSKIIIDAWIREETITPSVARQAIIRELASDQAYEGIDADSVIWIWERAMSVAKFCAQMNRLPIPKSKWTEGPEDRAVKS